METFRQRANTAFDFVKVSALALLLGGCAQFQQSALSITHPAATDESSNITIDNELSTFLDQAAENDAATFEHAPWGDYVDIQLMQRYLSASGRDCARLIVTQIAKDPRAALVCRNDKQWQLVEPLPQMSRM
jgi:hypothetical protein